MDPVDPIQPLRDALKVSPDNLPLRRHLAQMLAAAGRWEEAERELRDLLSRAPEDREAKSQLAVAFVRQQKLSQAMVLTEDLVRRGEATPAVLVLFARLLHHNGQTSAAVHQYKKAIDGDPSARDAALEVDLGLAARRSAPEPLAADDLDDDDEVFSDGPEPGAMLISPDDLERPQVSFADVGGMDAVKDQIALKIIHPLRHPEMYKAYGKSIGGGVLMYGPPGCGKTHLARATAGEVQAHFLAIGINDVLSMWMGQSETQLHELFEQARAHKPCVMFFDEVDALGASRSDMRNSAGRQLINQFLAELDGIAARNDGLLILAATNAPWHLDAAFRRPGRFDRVIFVPPPDAAARAAILRIHLKGKPADGVDVEAVAKKTEGCSGADLMGIIDRAVESKLREAMAKGSIAPLTTRDLLDAAKAAKPTTREWFATAKNHALYANQGGAYDDVLAYLKLT